MAPVRIVERSAKDIPALEPLWVAVHHVHQASMPELAPYVSDAETWAELRGHYDSIFEKSGTTLLLAYDGEDLVGYALAHLLAPVRQVSRGPRVASVRTPRIPPDVALHVALRRPLTK